LPAVTFFVNFLISKKLKEVNEIGLLPLYLSVGVFVHPLIIPENRHSGALYVCTYMPLIFAKQRLGKELYASFTLRPMSYQRKKTIDLNVRGTGQGEVSGLNSAAVRLTNIQVSEW
jgi:hypothetical protein